MLKDIQTCFQEGTHYYSRHAKEEMEQEEFGEILDAEVCDAILNGTIIEQYDDLKPYPACLIYGKTATQRPLHIVCAYAAEEQRAIVITVYQPDPERWINFTRRNL